jgi:hypothetical protein
MTACRKAQHYCVKDDLETIVPDQPTPFMALHGHSRILYKFCGTATVDSPYLDFEVRLPSMILTDAIAGSQRLSFGGNAVLRDLSRA